jgi:uncharacterized protein YkwD
MNPLLQALVEAHNNLRIEPYHNLEILNNFADAHAQWMASNKSLSHSDLSISGLQTLSVAENIAYGYRSVQTVMQGWLKSPGHRRNIHGNYQCIGVGLKDSYWCVVFVNLYDPPVSI